MGLATEGAGGDPWNPEGVPATTPVAQGRVTEGAGGDPWNTEGVPATNQAQAEIFSRRLALPPRMASLSASFRNGAFSTKSTPTGQSYG